MPEGEGQRYEQLSPKAYEHPADRAATSALHSIPLMDKVIKRLTDVAPRTPPQPGPRRQRRAHRRAPGAVAVVASYQRCGRSLDLDPLPVLYVTQTPLANALTVGAHRPIVIVYSGLARRLRARRGRRGARPRARPRALGALLLHDRVRAARRVPPHLGARGA